MTLSSTLAQGKIAQALRSTKDLLRAKLQKPLQIRSP